MTTTDQQTSIENLLAANKAVTKRTPMLDIAQARLENARVYTCQHNEEMCKQEETQKAAIAAKQKELADLQAQIQTGNAEVKDIENQTGQ